tara:strand:+ start:4768 stop:5661 length:894 start_codon:yes stop_codon:yes gene_type:complete
MLLIILITIIIILLIGIILILTLKYNSIKNNTKIGGNFTEDWFNIPKFITTEKLNQFNIDNLINTIGDNKVNISFFNNNHIIKKDIGSYPYSISNKYTLNKILKYTKYTHNIAYQYKTILSDTSNNYVDQWFFNKVKYITSKINNIYNIDNKLHILKLRINTIPWNYKTHFDCYDNYSVLLNGRKTFLLFKYNTTNITKINILLYKLQNLSIQNIIPILETYNIKYDIYTLLPGDMIYIPKYIWHYVSDNTTGNVSILLNYLTTDDDGHKCNKLFNTLWPQQAQQCKTNRCLDNLIL